MVKLDEFITDKVNVVEAYFCPNGGIRTNHPNIVSCGWTTLPPIPVKAFHNCIHYNIVEYNYRDLTCIYDVSTDLQKVLQRNYIADRLIDNTSYIVAINEEILPIHRFPNVNTLNDKELYHKTCYKFNNRILFNIEKDAKDFYTLILRYTHAHNVDLAKMSEDWTTAYTEIIKSIY